MWQKIRASKSLKKNLGIFFFGYKGNDLEIFFEGGKPEPLVILWLSQVSFCVLL